MPAVHTRRRPTGFASGVSAQALKHIRRGGQGPLERRIEGGSGNEVGIRHLRSSRPQRFAAPRLLRAAAESHRGSSTASAFTPITLRNITSRRSAWRHRPACSCRQLASARSDCASARSSMRCRSHPLRVLEEICMLDHMSGGRLESASGAARYRSGDQRGQLLLAQRQSIGARFSKNDCSTCSLKPKRTTAIVSKITHGSTRRRVIRSAPWLTQTLSINHGGSGRRSRCALRT